MEMNEDVTDYKTSPSGNKSNAQALQHMKNDDNYFTKSLKMK